MPFLIDGHNLIGQLPDISLDDPNDEARLVQKLKGFAAGSRKRITVIFDAGLPGGTSHLSNNAVEVVFAPTPGTADRLIMNRIEKISDPGNWTVVSSDRAVLQAGRNRGMKCLTSVDFARTLAMRPTIKRRRNAEKTFDEKPDRVDDLDYWLRQFGEK